MPDDRRRPAPLAPSPPPRARIAGAISITAAMIVGAISPPAWATEAAEAPEAAPADDPLAEVQRHLRKASDFRQQGLPAAAADHLEAAFRLLADARRWRDARGQVIAKAYETLLEAYNQAATADEKVRHVCRLRGLLRDNVAGLRAAFGDEASGFPEVRYAEQKITSVELTIQTHGDPQALCAAPAEEDAPLPTMPSTPLLLQGLDDPAPASTPADGAPAAAPAPAVDLVDVAQAQRKARAMTAAGASLIVAGGALLGVMGSQAWVAEQRERTIEALDGTAEEGGDTWNRAMSEGERAMSVAWVTGFTGGAALVAGIALTAVGRARLRRSDLSIVPSATPTSAGATLTLRF